jgi:hypothetical protein
MAGGLPRGKRKEGACSLFIAAYAPGSHGVAAVVIWDISIRAQRIKGKVRLATPVHLRR